MKTVTQISLVIAIAALIGSCSFSRSSVETPAHINFSQLEGVWYELASLPARTEDDCHCVTLEIDMENKDRMLIRNQCLMGEEKARFAEAWVAMDHKTRQGKLDLHYNKMGGTPYWIVDMGDLSDRFLVLAHPSKDNLWLLSRDPDMTLQDYIDLREAIAAAGFDTAFLSATDQSCYGGWVGDSAEAAPDVTNK